jgi:hypothetical protein
LRWIYFAKNALQDHSQCGGLRSMPDTLALATFRIPISVMKVPKLPKNRSELENDQGNHSRGLLSEEAFQRLELKDGKHGEGESRKH